MSNLNEMKVNNYNYLENICKDYKKYKNEICGSNIR